VPIDPSALSLEGKVAVVTGAARGIGEAIARTFADFGADVAMCDREPELMAATAESVRAVRPRCIDGVLDVRDAAAVESFFGAVAGAFGRVDVVVNNAAGTFRAPFLSASANAVDALVAENFTSATHVIRHAVPLMKDGGSIINVTSVEAHRAGPEFAVYSAMKAAMENLTKTLALELGDRAIRVNAIAPDLIVTPGTGEFAADPPLRRLGTPDDVAGGALFLASTLSGYMTGSTVHVDGGTWAAGGWRRRADGGWDP